MTQPAPGTYPRRFNIEGAVSTKHSFYEEKLEVNSETRLRELMEYNANRITRETIDKISDVLAREWLETYSRTFGITLKDVNSAAREKVAKALDDDHNIFPTGIGRE